ncbi:MAG: gliding motility-associated C-terminal domain-containing protein, partial [Bacteroidia bacterium]
ISDSAYLVIDNSNTNAITTLGTGGNIVSEGEFNVVKWNIGTATGNYVVPFTTASSVKIPLALNISVAGAGASGAILFSTYETSSDSNIVYPSDVTNMSSLCTSDNSLFAVDRFWRIDAGSYSTKPTPIIDFTYDDAVNELAGANTIVENNLQAQRFNSTINSWETPVNLFGVANGTLNMVSGVSVNPIDFYQSWTLIDTTCMMVTKTVNLLLCQGDSAFLQGQYQTTAGAYFDTIYVSGACDTAVTTNLSFTPQTTPSNAGVSVSVCGTMDTLAANVPVNGIGVWSVVSGTGTFTDTLDAFSEVTGLTYGPNVFQWTINNGVCPSSSSTVTITGVEQPSVSIAGTNQLICNDSALLSATTPLVGTGVWDLVSGIATIVDSSLTNTYVTGLTIGTTVLEWIISNSPCPSSTSTVSITNTGGPVISIVTQTNVACNGDSTGSAVIDVAAAIGNINYVWTGSVGTDTIASNLWAGSHTVTVTDSIGCTVTQSITITEALPIVISSSFTNVTCYGLTDGTASVTVVGGVTPYTYDWTPISSTGSNVTGLLPNTYTCTVTDSNACVATQVITISQPDSINAIIFSTPACGANNGAAEVSSVVGGTGAYSYSWSPLGGNGAIANSLTTGTYTCTITDANNCVYADSVSVVAFPNPIVTVSADTTINYGTSISITAAGADSYTWSPIGTLGCINCSTSVASPLETTTYCVVGVDTNTCLDTACVNITVNKECALAIPTAFSPNGDGANEMACFHGHCTQSFLIRIFDRWGEKVFETNDINQCWNGAFKGTTLNSAVFVYYADAILIDGTKVTQKGNITLIR